MLVPSWGICYRVLVGSFLGPASFWFCWGSGAPVPPYWGVRRSFIRQGDLHPPLKKNTWRVTLGCNLAVLRFGDGHHGMTATIGQEYRLTYRLIVCRYPQIGCSIINHPFLGRTATNLEKEMSLIFSTQPCPAQLHTVPVQVPERWRLTRRWDFRIS